MGTVVITTRTTITNTLVVENDDEIEGMTDQEITSLLQSDPEVLGRDDDPTIISDEVLVIERFDNQGRMAKSVDTPRW